MSSAPELNETLRRRDSAEGEGSGSAWGVALLHTFAEGRSRPKAKEQEVLDVATAYFLEHGYQGASINAMARSSGISKESIYRYFSSKKQLFEAVICRELAEYQAGVRRALSAEKTMDLREALINIAETLDLRRGAPFTRRRSALLQDRTRVRVRCGRGDLPLTPIGERLRSRDPE